MELIKDKFLPSYNYIKTLFKWMVIASCVGLIGGAVGSVFHLSIDYVTEFRTGAPWIVYFLPVGGVIIAFIYHIFRSKGNIDTNRVLEAASTDKNVPVVMVPLIFAGTVITHLLGGSAGREGAALQLGGGIGYNFGKLVKLKKRDMHIVVLAGMSGVFAALFGTPLTAAIFALEVVAVGRIYYAALLPCTISAVISFLVAGGFGVSPIRFDEVVFPAISAGIIIKSVVIAGVCALCSILFCVTIKRCEGYAAKLFKNNYIRAAVGGTLIVLFTLIIGTRDYNGAGMDVIAKALSGNARPEAFLLKIVFTAITISAGFKGGEIVPALFIGSTLGCTLGTVLGIDPSLAASLGFVALFCGVVNCPIASIMLSVEVFGAEGLLIFAIVCGVSYMLSGYFGLYKSQRFIYSKLNEDYLDISAK